jgi:hypothetical protein
MTEASEETNPILPAADTTPTTTTPLLSKKVNTIENCPADKTLIRILLVSGHKTDFAVSASDTIESFCQLVFREWPDGISKLTRMDKGSKINSIPNGCIKSKSASSR